MTNPDFTYIDAPIWFDPVTRKVTTTIDHVDPALRAFIEGLWPERGVAVEPALAEEVAQMAAEMAIDAVMMALSVAASRVRRA